MIVFKKILLIYFRLPFISLNNIQSFNDLNFKNIDFTNYRQIKSFIFKEKFHNLKNDFVSNFDFLNYSKNLGGKIGVSLSKKNIIHWFKLYKNKIGFPWIADFSSKRLINILYNYEFIVSSSTLSEKKVIDRIIVFHINRVLFEFNHKKIDQVNSYDLKAVVLSMFLTKKFNSNFLMIIDNVLDYQIDKFGMHKSYNLLTHAKFINNLIEIKNIFLFFEYSIPDKLNSKVLINTYS